jgi:lysophospholipase L1-like esterase
MKQRSALQKDGVRLGGLIAGAFLLPALLCQVAYVWLRTPRMATPDGPRTGSVGSAEPVIDIVFVGESTVAGIGVANVEDALPSQTAGQLSVALGRTVRWHAFGRLGATARIARERLVPSIKVSRADMVVIALGVNDTLTFGSPMRFSEDLRALIEAVRAMVGPAKVLLCPVPPVGRFPAFPQPLRWMLGVRASVLDEAAHGVAQTLPDVLHPVVDMSSWNESLFASDRLHPSARGYRRWAELLTKELARLAV